MGDQSGGNPRFKSAGTLWKSSWKGRVPYTEMCWFLGFDDDGAPQWYEDPGGVLPIVPAAGFWIGAVVGLAVPPPGGTEFISRNGGVGSEGWDLIVTDEGPTPAGERVSFTFRVFDGAGVAASATSSIFTLLLEPQLGISQNLFRVMAWFLPPPDGGAFGSINLSVEGTGAGGPFPLTAAYLNSSPYLTVGIGNIVDTALASPNCLHGLVGGDGVALGDDGDMLSTALAWAKQIKAEYQIVVAPTTFIPGLSPIVGWRANDPALGPGIAPNPLTPFVGAPDLVYGKPSPPNLAVACSQPSVFALANV